MNHKQALLTLERFLTPILSTDSSELAPLFAHTRLVILDKHERILSAGYASNTLWFLAQGLVRNVYTTKDGKEFNKSFISAPGFCGAMTEILVDTPSRFSIESMEPCTALAIPIDWFRQALPGSPALQTLARVIAEQLALKKEQREAELLLDDATTRYQNFVHNHPHLVQRIPAYHIASYLGITEVALSRIKRKLNPG